MHLETIQPLTGDETTAAPQKSRAFVVQRCWRPILHLSDCPLLTGLEMYCSRFKVRSFEAKRAVLGERVEPKRYRYLILA